MSTSPSLSATTSAADDRRPVLLLCLTVFLGYLTVGLPLPVIPLFVRRALGFSDLLVGVAVGIQFLATVCTRKYAGSIADAQGGHVALSRGLAACAAAGAVYMAAAWLPAPPSAKLAVLLLGRLLLGIGESLLLTGVLGWTLGIAGPGRAGRVMAWVGMAMYAALAVGAPAGVALFERAGFRGVGAAVIGLPLLGYIAMAGVPRTSPRRSVAAPFVRVVGIIWRPGVALGLQGVGFAGIGAFVTLYFAAMGWQGAGLALSAFGGAFILARLVCGGLPDRFGGARVALAFLAIEAVGQGVLMAAPNAGVGLAGAALTGFGCSLVFPGLGVETVRISPPECRATALGAFAAFQDVAYALTGPATGALAGAFGYRSVFLVGAAAAASGLLLVLPMLRPRIAR